MPECSNLEVDPETWIEVESKCSLMAEDYVELKNWLNNISSGLYFVTWDTVLFELKQDAVLFKLRYG